MFNNPFKACFSNNKYTVSFQTRTKLIESNKFQLVLTRFLKIIGQLYQLLIRFGKVKIFGI